MCFEDNRYYVANTLIKTFLALSSIAISACSQFDNYIQPRRQSEVGKLKFFPK